MITLKDSLSHVLCPSDLAIPKIREIGNDSRVSLNVTSKEDHVTHVTGYHGDIKIVGTPIRSPIRDAINMICDLFSKKGRQKFL